MDGYTYSQTLTISALSGVPENYQVRMVLTDTNFVFAHAKTDGSDIKFTESDGATELSHYFESYDSDTQIAIVWVKVPSISASIDTDIMIWYGNESATSSSNGSTTFDKFWEFDGSVLPDDLVGTASVSDGALTIATSNNVNSVDTYDNVKVMFKINSYSADDAIVFGFGAGDWVSATERRLDLGYPTTGKYGKYDDGWNTIDTTIDLTKTIEIKKVGTDAITVKLDSDIITTMNSYDGALKIAMRASSDKNAVFERIYVAKAIATEVTITFGVEYDVNSLNPGSTLETTDPTDHTGKIYIDPSLSIWTQVSIPANTTKTIYFIKEIGNESDSSVQQILTNALDTSVWAVNEFTNYYMDQKDLVMLAGYIQKTVTCDGKIVEIVFEKTNDTQSGAVVLSLADKCVLRIEDTDLVGYLDDTLPDIATFTETDAFISDGARRITVDLTNGTEIFLDGISIYSDIAKIYTGLTAIKLGGNIRYKHVKLRNKVDCTISMLEKNYEI